VNDPLERLVRLGLEPLELALLDHHHRGASAQVRLRFDDGAVLEAPVSWFFRSVEELDSIDRVALDRAEGRILDVGAGTGVHALPLVRRGHDVTALEILPGAVEILRSRGVPDARLESVWRHRAEEPYDTVLLLMNGTGVAGTLGRLGPLLERVRTLLAPHGTLLVDSTDPGAGEYPDGREAGERHLQIEVDGVRGPPFPHLYAAPSTLASAALRAGLSTEVVLELEEEGRYLAACRRLSL
jgi:SAM-dependent methyltransferase